MFFADDITRGLATRVIGNRVIVLESTDSTNLRARELADQDAPEGTVIVADEQTAGRGRQGRSWRTEPGTSLLFSVLLRPSLPSDRSVLMTFGAAVAVAEAVEEVTGLSAQTKWPNDLLLDGRKFCGILLEGTLGRAQTASIIVGIGINVNQTGMPDGLRLPATSLRMITGRTIDRVALLRSTLAALDRWYATLQDGATAPLLDAWRARCRMFDRPAILDVGGRTSTVTVLRLAEDGGLVVDHGRRTETIYAADVTTVS